jgi:hypothetical protein
MTTRRGFLGTAVAALLALLPFRRRRVRREVRIPRRRLDRRRLRDPHDLRG